jgi:hypothetical protein
VQLVPAGPGALSGVYVAPDERGGGWVRVDGRLVRTRASARQPAEAPGCGATVGLRIAAAPRVLHPSGRPVT